MRKLINKSWIAKENYGMLFRIPIKVMMDTIVIPRLPIFIRRAKIWYKS